MRERLTISNEDFFREIITQINRKKEVKILAKGNSMLPFIRNMRDSIVLSLLRERFKIGDVVLARTNTGSFVIHRIEMIEGTCVTLRGDGNICETEICNANDILADVIKVIRNGKTIRKDSIKWKMMRMMPSNRFMRRVFLGIYKRLK